MRAIAKNARAMNEDELFRAAKLKLFAILPAEEQGTLAHAVWQSIHALEDALSEERGKTIRLSRTRQKIGRVGERECVADLVMGKESDGFKLLLERRMLHLSFEALALGFADQFNAEVLVHARERLAAHSYVPQ
ncbi:hypothetical protein EKN06_07530 [Croceicoccus ponticola]|uniref:Uncharacterized protein n=1 Tax=Croceicoccus ponticola TaxID=2217664 RepID=A0A437GYL0_9SPHN|nr:hypothetical protein [Croceicoccus ponticola]RVQ67767.1 hypothetical protein EKN06_07530 [Croceicoccus ponticola]